MFSDPERRHETEITFQGLKQVFIFYSVAVKHETGELIYDTDSFIGGNKSANNKMTLSLL